MSFSLSTRGLCSLAALALIGACREADGANRTAPARRMQETEWSVQWRVKAPTVGNAPAKPLRLTTYKGRVYVVDPTVGIVSALNAANGKVLWTTRGTDSLKLTNPRDIIVTKGGKVAVADMDRRALVLLDSTGALRRSIPILPPVYSMCAVGDSILMLTWNVTKPVWLVDANTGASTRYELPWVDSTESRTSAPRSGNFQGNQNRDACVFTREDGDGFVVWRQGGFERPRKFIEQSTNAAREFKGHITAVNGALVDDTVYVLFNGVTADRRRIIDVYDAATGAYGRTLTTPYELMWLARDGKSYYGIIPNKESSREIVAFSQRGR